MMLIIVWWLTGFSTYRNCALRSGKLCLGKTMPGLELIGKGNLIFMYISSNHQLYAYNGLINTLQPQVKILSSPLDKGYDPFLSH